MNRKLIMKFVSVIAAWLLCGAIFCQAQLPDDVQDIFERLVDDLDDDLAAKFKQAIKKKSSTIEFTPSQFRRFRDSPSNPFDGLDDVDASEGAGNIALKFELPSIRQRHISTRERQHPSQLNQFQSIVQSAVASTVGIFEGDKQVALGIIVDSAGLIITKASEIESRKDLVCRFANGRRTSATLIRSDNRNDVALLSVEASQAGQLTPIHWATNQPLLGSFVVVPDERGKAISIGAFSSNVRSTVYGEQAFLGVQPQTTSSGVRVSDIQPGSASHTAGLRDGDTIVRMQGQAISDVSDLVYLIRTKRPGDRVEIEYLRDGAAKKTVAELAGRRLSGERAARFKMMSRLGAIPSRRADGFPVIFQHDAPLFPENCGGPLVDLDGKVIGMNIARSGRAASYAIPANHLQTVIEDLTRASLAQRNDGNLQN